MAVEGYAVGEGVAGCEGFEAGEFGEGGEDVGKGAKGWVIRAST